MPDGAGHPRQPIQLDSSSGPLRDYERLSVQPNKQFFQMKPKKYRQITISKHIFLR